MLNTLLKISIQGLQLLGVKNQWKSHVASDFPQKLRLGPQNGSRSSGPKKMIKIVNCAIIKETKKRERKNGGGPSGIVGWPPIST